MLSQFLEKQIPEMKEYLKEDHAGFECQIQSAKLYFTIAPNVCMQNISDNKILAKTNLKGMVLDHWSGAP